MEKVLVIVLPGSGARELKATLRSLAMQRLRPNAVVAARGWFDSGAAPEGLPVRFERAGGNLGAWVTEVLERYPGFYVAFAPRGQLTRPEKLAGSVTALQTFGAGWLSHGACDCGVDYLADARARAGALGDDSDWGRVVLGPETAAAWAKALRAGAEFAPKVFAEWTQAQGIKSAKMPDGWQVIPRAGFEPAMADRLALTLFAGKARGKRAFIIGNGPSLRRMDLSKLAGEVTGASNGFYLMFPELKWRPTFYACVDTQVLPDQAVELAAARAQAPGTDFFFPHEIVDDETWNLRWSVPTLILPDEHTCYFPQVPAFWTTDPFDAFPRDPSDGLYAAQTVTVTLLQLAVLYECNPIYLIGCDHAYQVPATARATPALEGGPEVLESTADDDGNHFSPKYFGRGRRWHQPNLAGMERHYEAAKQAAKGLGVEIFNAGVDSKLEVFPRVEYGGLF
jgi:hypothetical protein